MISNRKHRKYFQHDFLASLLHDDADIQAAIADCFRFYDPVWSDSCVMSDVYACATQSSLADFINQHGETIEKWLFEYDYDCPLQAVVFKIENDVNAIWDNHTLLSLARKQHKYNKGA